MCLNAQSCAAVAQVQAGSAEIQLQAAVKAMLALLLSGHQSHQGFMHSSLIMLASKSEDLSSHRCWFQLPALVCRIKHSALQAVQ